MFSILICISITIVFILGPLKIADSKSLNYQNEKLSEYKIKNKSKYVDLNDPEYKEILKKGNQYFLLVIKEQVFNGVMILSILMFVSFLFNRWLPWWSGLIMIAPLLFAFITTKILLFSMPLLSYLLAIYLNNIFIKHRFGKQP